MADFPQSLPLEVVKLVNARIDAVQEAGRTVGLTVIGTLPEDLRALAAAPPLAIEAVVDGVQDAVEDAATPTPQPLTTQAGAGTQLQRSGGTGLDAQDQVGDPGVPPKKPRGPLVNILKHNPLNPGNAAINGQGAGDDGDEDQATETGTTVKRPRSASSSAAPGHRPGAGKIGLRDLAKRVLGGGAEADNEGAPKNEGGSSGESATG